MRIVEEYDDFQVELIKIKSAIYMGEYSIKIFFNDGVIHVADFKAFLKSSLHPSIRKYLDETKFKQFEIVDGNLNWNDYNMIFPIDDLYEGKSIL